MEATTAICPFCGTEVIGIGSIGIYRTPLKSCSHIDWLDSDEDEYAFMDKGSAIKFIKTEHKNMQVELKEVKK